MPTFIHLASLTINLDHVATVEPLMRPAGYHQGPYGETTGLGPDVLSGTRITLGVVADPGNSPTVEIDGAWTYHAILDAIAPRRLMEPGAGEPDSLDDPI